MRQRGYSMVEMVVCLALATVLAGAGAPALTLARQGARAEGATDYLVGRLQMARLEALRRHVNVALRFEADGASWWLALYADGNGNGVRAADIAAGTDYLLCPREQLERQFPCVGFGVHQQAVLLPDDSSTDTSDPIHVGKSRMFSFSPTGTASSGTVYLCGQGLHQTAVRVLGVTGRVRSLTFDFASADWEPR